MLRNATNLVLLGRAFNASFQGGLEMAPPDWNRVATEVPSSTKQNDYGWLGQIPGVREWVGDRVINNLEAHEYSIKNKKYELTIAVKGDDIDDDNIGIYSPMFTEMGRSVAAHPSQLVYGLLKQGFATTCYDGQYYFDTDHPVIDDTGATVSVANTDGGAGAPWFLIDTNRALKPIIYQNRKPFTFVAKDKPTDDNVFDRDEFKYGVDGRSNVGFGFWQFAWGSKQTLDDAHYAAARSALINMKGDQGRPLGLMPNLLVVDATNEEAARRLVKSLLINGGESNPWAGTADVLVTPWLA